MQQISLAMLVQWTDIAVLAIGGLLYYYGRIQGRRAGKREMFEIEQMHRTQEELSELRDQIDSLKND